MPQTTERRPSIYSVRAWQIMRLVEELGQQQLVGAELGVFRGATSANLLHRFPMLTLHMVDPWEPPDPGSDYRKTGDQCSRQTADEHLQNMRQALENTEFAVGRRIVHRMTSEQAAKLVPDGSLDFFFADDDHSKSGVLKTLNAWMPKLRKGGIPCGHDYNTAENKCGRRSVTEAVDAFAEQHGFTVHVGDHAVWWYERAS